MKEGEPRPEPKDPHYSEKGDHKFRHDYQQGVQKEVRHCSHQCASCPMAKSCSK
jgi:hypothetical protein